MNVIYVNKRCEVSMLKHAFEAAGLRCFRVSTRCECKGMGNIRQGVIVLDGDKAILEIRRCKECFRQRNPKLLAGGVGR